MAPPTLAARGQSTYGCPRLLLCGSFKLEVTESVLGPLARAHAAMDTGLDEEFKRIVAEMKPHAKKLP